MIREKSPGGKAGAESIGSDLATLRRPAQKAGPGKPKGDTENRVPPSWSRKA